MSLRDMNYARWSSVFAVFLLLMVSCGKQEKTAETKVSAAPETFASPDEAAEKLVAAAKSDDPSAMLTIFGASSKDLIYSGDSAGDKTSFAGFVSDYNVMHRWRKLPNGSELLLTGADNNAFPIPLSKNAAGQWSFDVEAGKREILARRIGRNELAAIDVCAIVGAAQEQYYAQRHDGVQQFAQKFISDKEGQNGLYWQSADSQVKSPLGPLVAFATEEGYNVNQTAHQPFHGYYFQILKKQGPDAKGGAKDYVVNGKMTRGFAVLAYPAQYGDSGIMTFVLNQNGIVYEKDLGKSTDQLAAGMSEFNPDKSWKAVGL